MKIDKVAFRDIITKDLQQSKHNSEEEDKSSESEDNRSKIDQSGKLSKSNSNKSIKSSDFANKLKLDTPELPKKSTANKKDSQVNEQLRLDIHSINSSDPSASDEDEVPLLFPLIFPSPSFHIILYFCSMGMEYIPFL